jgi:hypothetical protein
MTWYADKRYPLDPAHDHWVDDEESAEDIDRSLLTDEELEALDA